MPPPEGADTALLRELIAGQARSDARFDEVFKRLEKAEEVGAAARDAAREIVTILREQDALARVAEVKADTRSMIADLRADVVKAITGLKESQSAQAEEFRPALSDLDERLATLEAERTEKQGMAKGARLIAEGVKLLIAAGGGAFLVKLFGGH